MKTDLKFKCNIVNINSYNRSNTVPFDTCIARCLTISPFLCLALTVEQYYTTNILKNQLVQNDIRVAKKLQDEEEEQQAQQSALQRQASRQL